MNAWSDHGRLPAAAMFLPVIFSRWPARGRNWLFQKSLLHRKSLNIIDYQEMK
jgi:hypothetical protein